MIDIVSLNDGEDMGVANTQTTRAANILSVQLGALEYEPTLGIDLEYFLSDEIHFQNASFKAYLVQVLAERGINVSSVIETINNLFSDYVFNIRAEDETGGFIAR